MALAVVRCPYWSLQFPFLAPVLFLQDLVLVRSLRLLEQYPVLHQDVQSRVIRLSSAPSEQVEL